MNPRGIPTALKSVPDSRSIATLLSLTDHGTAGAVNNQGAAQFRLVDDNTISYHEGLLAIQVKTTGGKGGTPTAVGASVTFTLKYAWSDYDLDPTEVPTVLATTAESLICALPNAISARATGVLTCSGLPSVGSKVVIARPSTAFRQAVAFGYEWSSGSGPGTVLNDGPLRVYQGISAATAATNILKAIGLTGAAGTDYSLTMPINSLVTAATGGAGIVNLSSREYSSAANNILTNENDANTSFGAATLTGGSSAGTALFATQPFVHRGRFLYVWYDRLAFAANALIDVEAKLIRL